MQAEAAGEALEYCWAFDGPGLPFVLLRFPAGFHQVLLINGALDQEAIKGCPLQWGSSEGAGAPRG